MTKQSKTIANTIRVAREVKPHSFPKKKDKAGGGSVNESLHVKSPGSLMRLHPAMDIPGVHIRTAETGEPVFKKG